MGVFEDFWKNFWPNFFSNIASGIILTYIISLFIEYIRKPKLDIVLSIATSTRNVKRLDFYCINSGKIGLMPNEIQWYLYFDSAFKLNDEGIDWIITGYNDTEIYMLNGTNLTACLPGSSCLLASIDVTLDSKRFKHALVDEGLFCYSLTTIQGEKGKSNFFKKDKKTDFIEDSSLVKRRVFKIEQISI